MLITIASKNQSMSCINVVLQHTYLYAQLPLDHIRWPKHSAMPSSSSIVA
jgi:hypothetical protein